LIQRFLQEYHRLSGFGPPYLGDCYGYRYTFTLYHDEHRVPAAQVADESADKFGVSVGVETIYHVGIECSSGQDENRVRSNYDLYILKGEGPCLI